MKEYFDIDTDNINDFRCDVCGTSKINMKLHSNIDMHVKALKSWKDSIWIYVNL